MDEAREIEITIGGDFIEAKITGELPEPFVWALDRMKGRGKRLVRVVYLKDVNSKQEYALIPVREAMRLLNQESGESVESQLLRMARHR